MNLTESRRVPPIPVIVAAALLIASFVVFTYGTLGKLNYPHAINYGEGVVLDQMRRVSEAPGLYPAFESAPYLIDNYPPVYPILASWMPTPRQAPFFGGRLLSMLGTLVSAWMIGLLVRRWSGDAAALLCAALYLALPEVHRFAELLRVDSLGIAFGLVGCYLIQREGMGSRVAGCAAFFLCIYTRHSLLALPAAGFLLLLRQEGFRSLIWPAGLLVAGVLGYGALHLWTDGRVYDHLIHFNVLSYSWVSTQQKWFATLYPWRLPLILAGFLALVPLAPVGRFRWSWSFLGFVICGMGALYCMNQTLLSSARRYFWPGEGEKPMFGIHQADLEPALASLQALHIWVAVAAVLVILRWRPRSERPEDDPTGGLFTLLGFGSAALIGRVGSDVNYLYELLALLCLTIGWGIGKAPKWWKLGIWCAAVLAIAANLMLLFSVAGGLNAERMDQVKKRDRRLLGELLNLPGPVLSEDPALLPLLGRPLEYQAFMYRALLESQRWDPEPLLNDLREQRFAAIVIHAVGVSADPSTMKPVILWVRGQDCIPKVIFEEQIVPHYQWDGKTRILEKVTEHHWNRWEIWVPR